MLHLFYADELMGEWKEHPKSPVVQGNARTARCGGRIVATHGKIYRFAQECDKTYGYQVTAFEVMKMSVSDYEEREVDGGAILRPTGKGWNGEKMHHIDTHEVESGRWIACVDGVGRSYHLMLR